MTQQHSRHFENFLTDLDYLAHAPIGHRRTISYRNASVVFTPSHIFITSDKELLAFVDLMDVKENLKDKFT